MALKKGTNFKMNIDGYTGVFKIEDIKGSDIYARPVDPNNKLGNKIIIIKSSKVIKSISQTDNNKVTIKVNNNTQMIDLLRIKSEEPEEGQIRIDRKSSLQPIQISTTTKSSNISGNNIQQSINIGDVKKEGVKSIDDLLAIDNSNITENDEEIIVNEETITGPIIDEPMIEENKVVVDEPMVEEDIVVDEPMVEETSVIIDEPMVEDDNAIIDEPVIEEKPVVKDDDAIIDGPVIEEANTNEHTDITSEIVSYCQKKLEIEKFSIHKKNKIYKDNRIVYVCKNSIDDSTHQITYKDGNIFHQSINIKNLQSYKRIISI